MQAGGRAAEAAPWAARELAIDGAEVDVGAEQEYPEIYRRFARLIAARDSDADISPLRIVADACLKGRQTATDPFHD